MEFRNIEERDYASFLKLYNGSFPENERRIYDGVAHFSDFVKEKNGKFRVLVIDDEEGHFIGFLSYWTFDGYVYVEHFAVDPEQRGKNIGGRLLSYLLDAVSADVVLEVEKPDTPVAARRIRFYERCGFKLRDDIEYVQPPYSASQSGVEMLLMTHGDVRLHDKNDLREMLSEVYGFNNP